MFVQRAFRACFPAGVTAPTDDNRKSATKLANALRDLVGVAATRHVPNLTAACHALAADFLGPTSDSTLGVDFFSHVLSTLLLIDPADERIMAGLPFDFQSTSVKPPGRSEGNSSPAAGCETVHVRLASTEHLHPLSAAVAMTSERHIAIARQGSSLEAPRKSPPPRLPQGMSHPLDAEEADLRVPHPRTSTPSVRASEITVPPLEAAAVLPTKFS